MGRFFGVVGPSATDHTDGDLQVHLARCHRQGVVPGKQDKVMSGPGYGLAVRGDSWSRSPDGRHVCLLDGSLARAEVLRRTLEAKGFAAAGATCADVFLDAFFRHGVLFLKHLPGSFAAAVFDTLEQRLFLAVDPYGLKRLYVADLPDGLVFSSDLTGLARSGLVPLTVGEQGAREYFSLGFVSPPWTIYRDVMSLPIGEYLTWEKGTARRETYHHVIGEAWEFSKVDHWSEDRLIDHLQGLVVGAVGARLPRENIPVAAYLSGGLDTGMMAAVMVREFGREVTAFTLGSTNRHHDEVPRARKVAAYFGIRDHRCLYITEDECFAAQDELPEVFGQPMADISAIPNLVVTRAVAREFSSVMAGDGPDGLYGNWDLRPWYWYYRIVPRALRGPLARMVDFVDRCFDLGLSTPTRCVADLLQQDEFAWVFHKKFTGRNLSALLGREIRSADFELGRYLRDRTDIPLYERLRMAMAKYFVMHGVLLKAGAIHNALQVDQVCPYYDRDLVDFICAMPTRFKTRGRGYGKFLHRKLLERYAPARVWKGRKQGFIFDIHDFGTGRIHGLVRKYLADERIAESGVMDVPTVSGLREEYLGGSRHRFALVKTILDFEIWREKFLR